MFYNIEYNIEDETWEYTEIDKDNMYQMSIPIFDTWEYTEIDKDNMYQMSIPIFDTYNNDINDIPIIIYRNECFSCTKHNGRWCDILLSKNVYHWVYYDTKEDFIIPSELCINCKYIKFNKKFKNYMCFRFTKK